MTPQEIEHQDKKSKLRQVAIDRELQRLRNINRKQSTKITNLRKALYFQIFFFVSLILVFLIKGMINFSGSASSDEFEKYKVKYNDLLKINTSLDDSLTEYRNRLNVVLDKNLEKREEKGLKFRVQIGAFKEINLKDFRANLVAISQETYDSINQYTLGAFTDYEKAKVFLGHIRKMGFNDSFIISTKNGRRIPVESLSDSELYPQSVDSVRQ